MTLYYVSFFLKNIPVSFLQEILRKKTHKEWWIFLGRFFFLSSEFWQTKTKDPDTMGWYACMLSCFSCVWLFFTPWTVAPQAPPSMGFSRQECWSGLPCPPPGDLPDPGNEPVSLRSPALAGGFFTTSVGTKHFWIDKQWNYSLNTIFVAKTSVTWIRTLSGFTV